MGYDLRRIIYVFIIMTTGRRETSTARTKPNGPDIALAVSLGLAGLGAGAYGGYKEYQHKQQIVRYDQFPQSAYNATNHPNYYE